MTVAGGGAVGIGGGAGLAGTGGGATGAPTLAGFGAGRSAGFDGAAPIMLATNEPWLSQSLSPPLGSPCT